MSVSRYSLAAFAALLSLAASDPNSICYSYGVDFVDEGHYFINTLSNDNFTCVSTFEGCNPGPDLADILFIPPDGDELFCSSVTTTPDDTPMLSTCPIEKSQMVSGDYMLLVVGNNDDGQPFAWQRDLYLDCGPQATTTYTPVVTYNVTSTPIVTQNVTSTLVITSTIGPNATFTVPSKTAKRTKTITPTPVTQTNTKTFTRTKYTWTKELSITTKTKYATCTTPTSSKPDKPCTYSPTLIHPAALETPTSSPKFQRYMRKDRAVDVEYARARIAAAKLKRDQKAKEAAAPIEERAPDAPTLTITASVPINTTVTYTAAPSTTTESTVLSSTTTTTLPPVTVFSGVFTNTVTLPPQTKTRLTFVYTATTVTETICATFTRTTTVVPTASVPACKRVGGHFGPGRW